MSDLNRVFLTGNLTHDPQLNFTAEGKAICKFRIASNQTWGTGEQKNQRTLFISVDAWGAVGESAANYLKKGRKVLVEGELVQSNWTTKNGELRAEFRINANRVQFLSPPETTLDTSTASEEPARTKGDDDIDPCPF